MQNGLKEDAVYATITIKYSYSREYLKNVPIKMVIHLKRIIKVACRPNPV